MKSYRPELFVCRI